MSKLFAIYCKNFKSVLDPVFDNQTTAEEELQLKIIDQYNNEVDNLNEEADRLKAKIRKIKNQKSNKKSAKKSKKEESDDESSNESDESNESSDAISTVFKEEDDDLDDMTIDDVKEMIEVQKQKLQNKYAILQEAKKNYVIVSFEIPV